MYIKILIEQQVLIYMYLNVFNFGQSNIRTECVYHILTKQLLILKRIAKSVKKSPII